MLLVTLRGTKKEGEECGPCFNPSTNNDCGSCEQGLKCKQVPKNHIGIIPRYQSDGVFTRTCQLPRPSQSLSGNRNEKIYPNANYIKLRDLSNITFMHNSFPIQEIANVPIMYLTVDTETVQKTMVKKGRFAMSRNHQHVQMWQIASLKGAGDSRIRPVPMEVVVSLSYLHPIFVTTGPI